MEQPGIPRNGADDDVIARLRAASRSLQPGHMAEDRERLLRAVAEQRAAPRPAQERLPMFNFITGTRRLALGAAAVLAVGAAGVVGASGGVSDVAGNVGDVLAALHVTDRTPDVADEHIDAIEQPDGSGEGAGTPDEHANENASEGAGNADDGIDNSNASDTGRDHAADPAFNGSGNADGAPDLPTQADEHAGGNGGTPDLPDAADNAHEGVDPGPPDDAPANGDADLPDQAP